MAPTIDYYREAPRGLAALRQLEEYLHECGLPAPLLHLIKTRASQINGCAYCLDMHTKDARAVGETEQRLYTLPAWRETPFFSERERAALAYTEALTLIAGHPDTDARVEDLRRHFSDKEIVDLTLAITAINSWNRLAIAFHAPVGSYQPRIKAQGQSGAS